MSQLANRDPLSISGQAQIHSWCVSYFNLQAKVNSVLAILFAFPRTYEYSLTVHSESSKMIGLYSYKTKYFFFLSRHVTQYYETNDNSFSFLSLIFFISKNDNSLSLTYVRKRIVLRLYVRQFTVNKFGKVCYLYKNGIF